MLRDTSGPGGLRMAIDSAILKIKGAEGKKYLAALTAVGDSLAAHQKQQWNDVIAASGQGNRIPAGEEWTAADPRIMHCLLVADMYLEAVAESSGDSGQRAEAATQAVKRYLYSRGYISEHSLPESIGNVVTETKEAVLDGLYTNLLSLQLGEEYDEIVHRKGISEEERRRLLIAASKEKRDEMWRKVEQTKSRPYPRSFWITIGVLLALFVALVAYTAAIN